MSHQLVFVIILALIFEFLNGMRDSSNIVATMISSRVFRPRIALGLTAVSEFLGTFLFGLTVATTIGISIVNAEGLTLDTLVASLIGTITWNLLTWFFGIPSSSSHALIGGLIGAAFVSAGASAINFQGLYQVLYALFASPVVGFIMGFLVLRTIYFLAKNSSPRINEFFKSSHIFTTIGLALSYGSNDGQKTIGIIALSLLVGGYSTQFIIPYWVILISASALALGTTLGGYRLIRTLGGRFYKIRPVHSFATQLTSSFIIFSASLIGLPVSTTHIVSSAIVGIGASERFGKVRWGVAGDIVIAWLITIPFSALLAAAIYWLLYGVK